MSRCPKSDAAANNGYIEDLYKVSADFEMKLTAAHAEIAELRAKCERLEKALREIMETTDHPRSAELADNALLDKSANPGGTHE